MKIWENDIIRDMTPEEEKLYEESMASIVVPDDPHDIIDVLTGEKQ